MTNRSKVLLPGHRVSVRNGAFKTQDTTIILQPGDTLSVTTVTAPPPTGLIPVMPAGGDLLRWSAADKTLAPWRQVDYPDDPSHAGGEVQWANNFRGGPADLVSFVTEGADTFLRLKTIPQQPMNPASRWWSSMISTGMDGKGGNSTWSIDTGYLEAAVRFIGLGFAYWGTPVWMRDDVETALDPNHVGWGGTEFELAEPLEDGKAHAALWTPTRVEKASFALDESWHRIGIAIAADHVQFTRDGAKVGTPWMGKLARVNLLGDAKVGLKWTGQWPDPTKMPPLVAADLGWVVASSTIPAWAL